MIKELAILQVGETELPKIRDILTLYGEYMFDQLKLTAGKDTFEADLKNFPFYKYIPPKGCFLMAFVKNEAVGCVSFKAFDDTRCELKRMFVLPKFRKNGIGMALLEQVFINSRLLGYKEIILDTNEEMAEAVALYKKFGFYDILPFCENGNPHVLFLGRKV